MSLLFVGVVLGLTALLHLYLWQRLVRDTTRESRWRRRGGLALAGAALVMVVTLLAESWVTRPAGWLAAPGYVWLGLLFYLTVSLLALELPVLAARLVGAWRRRSGAPAPVWTASTASTASTAPAASLPAAAATSPGPGTSQCPDTSPGPGSSGDAGTPATSRAGSARAAADDGDPPARTAAAADPGRRWFLRRAAALTAGVATAGFGGYGIVRAYAPPAVTRLQVPVPRLDPRADGLRVAVLADLHVGPLYRGRQVERVVELVNGLDADLVTVVGDLVSSEVGAVRESATPLRRMRSRYGAFFVTGNHEYYTGHEEWIDAAEELGLRVLRNERVEIVHNGGAVDLAGVNDVEGGRYDDPPDYAAALGDRDGTRPVVLLAHQPVQVHRAAAYGVDLQLSGHTHGGQLAPFNLLVRLEQPVVSGLAEVDGTQVYVTNGAGFWGPPMRVGAEPEITLLELRATSG